MRKQKLSAMSSVLLHIPIYEASKTNISFKLQLHKGPTGFLCAIRYLTFCRW